jgi:carbonic anhydrase
VRAHDAAHSGETGGDVEPAELWKRLMDGNQRFVAGEPQERELVETRAELAKGQHAKVVVLTCADSRLCPELIFDQNLGDLFVIRVAGNIADRIGRGSIEYAVEHLHARLRVVLGHEKCGAVAAAASGKRMPTANLRAIVAQVRPALAGIQAPPGSEQLTALGVAANVRRSAQDLLSHSPVLKKEAASGKLSVIRAVYRLKSGEVVKL